MENSTEVLKAVISGNAALLNEILQSLNSTERVSVLAAQDYTDEALKRENVIGIPCKTTPLIVAVQSGNLDCVKLLLNYKADIEEQGDLESLRYDVFHPDDVRSIVCWRRFKSVYTGPPLFLAAANGNLDILSYLFEQGADVNASSYSRGLNGPFRDCLSWHTPLIDALRNGHNDAFTFLIDKGADVNLPDRDGYTALHYAVKSKNFDALSCLVHNGADVNLFTSYEHSTPLILACQSHNKLDAINALLNKGADVNHQDRNGQSALHFASSDICDWLIQHLADVNMCDNGNWTPLMLASRKSDVKKVATLIENGAKVDLQDINGNTALHHAVLSSYDSHEYTPEICLALLTAKASHLCNSEGWTPLLLASENCITSVVEILIKHPEVTKEQRANTLELLGSSLCLKSKTFAIEEGFSYIKLGMKERFADASHPLLKQQVELAEAYQNRRESQTLEELAEIDGDEDSIIMESLVIRERIFGANNIELLEPIERVAKHFYSRDPGRFKSIPLYRYATKIAQGKDLYYESAVSCLWHLTDVLYECKQYSDKELLLELLELTVFLYENDMPDYYRIYWLHRFVYLHDDEEVSLFDSVEVVIHMITKNLQNDEEDETYSNVLVLLRKLLRHNPRCMNYKGTLLHVSTYSTEEIITDIVPSADTVKLLLNAGFNVNATDCDGDTPLHRAASLEPGDDLIHQVPEIMKALFDGGAHHDFVNNDGKTPMDMAKTDEARMILSERRKLELECISARAVKKFGIPYLGVVPKTLEKYISMH